MRLLVGLFRLFLLGSTLLFLGLCASFVASFDPAGKGNLSGGFRGLLLVCLLVRVCIYIDSRRFPR